MLGGSVCNIISSFPHSFYYYLGGLKRFDEPFDWSSFTNRLTHSTYVIFITFILINEDD